MPTLETPVFDHLSIGVTDLDRSVAFYDAVLAPLGCVRLWRKGRAAGYGPIGFAGEAPFAVLQVKDGSAPAVSDFHLAFIAPSRDAVDAFHAGALAFGGHDDGPPGIRENYDPGYYAAFVRDPDGHRIEAVLHEKDADASRRAGDETT